MLNGNGCDSAYTSLRVADAGAHWSLLQASTLIRCLEAVGRLGGLGLGIPLDSAPHKLQKHTAERMKAFFMEFQQETHENIPSSEFQLGAGGHIPREGGWAVGEGLDGGLVPSPRVILKFPDL